MWSFSSYNRIRRPRRKNVLIDDEKLRKLIESVSYDQLKSSHRGWIDEYLGNGTKSRQDEWTDSIAVASKSFIEKVKALLGFKAKGRDIISRRKLLPTWPFSGSKKTI